MVIPPKSWWDNQKINLNSQENEIMYKFHTCILGELLKNIIE
jgi:hypothetical protein